LLLRGPASLLVVNKSATSIKMLDFNPICVGYKETNKLKFMADLKHDRLAELGGNYAAIS